MDTIDRKILAYIQRNGRDSYADIGAAVSLSVSAVNERLKKLQSHGVIKEWSATVAPAKLDAGVAAFIFVALDGSEDETRFVESVTAWPAIQECHHVTGSWSYLLKARLRDIAAVEDLLRDLKQLPGLVKTESLIALSSPKETSFVPCFPSGSRDASGLRDE